MCFPFDAIVPDLPPAFRIMAGGAAGERLTLKSADGTEFSAYLARADGPTGVVVLPERVITVGFCFGGAQSFMQAAEGHAGLAGVVGFYGSLVREGQRWSIDRAPDAKVPVLGLFAGTDDSITPEQVAAFDAALEVEHEINTYEGAPYSFFDRRQEQYAEASQDAWERILGFISKLQVEV